MSIWFISICFSLAAHLHLHTRSLLCYMLHTPVQLISLEFFEFPTLAFFSPVFSSFRSPRIQNQNWGKILMNFPPRRRKSRCDRISLYTSKACRDLRGSRWPLWSALIVRFSRAKPLFFSRFSLSLSLVKIYQQDCRREIFFLSSSHSTSGLNVCECVRSCLLSLRALEYIKIAHIFLSFFLTIILMNTIAELCRNYQNK